MRQLSDLTIKEYYDYLDMLEGDTPDVFGIFDLFGMDARSMPFDEYERNRIKIKNMYLPTKGVHKHYKINGVRFKAELNHLTVSAGQFVDFQTYMQDFKIEEVLSVFLIPQYKKFGMWKTRKYNDGYDVIEIQKDILNHMTIGDANELSNFFLKSSVKLLELMKASSEKKEIKMRKKRLKQMQDTLG